MKNKFLNSLRFKTWSYFVIFALSILLLLQIFQLVLFEPFYRNTMRNELKTIVQNITSIYFSDKDVNDINTDLNSLTQSKNACILIYDKENGTTTGYDSLGEGSCVIYNDSSVNQELINELDNETNSTIFKEGYLINYSNKELMVLGQKVTHQEKTYYVFANIALQSINYLTRTNQYQLITITFILFILSLIMSAVFSNLISRPIVKIKNEASKLTYGNYDLHFDDIEINEVSELAETLAVASNEIKRVEDARNELLANVSHDLKTPLTMIKAYTELIRDISGDNKQKRQEHLAIILQETDFLSNMVSDILNLSSLQAGKNEIKIEPFDLSTLIDDTLARFKLIAEKDNVQIDADCDKELVALGDENRIAEVLYNFLSNALKHYGEDHKVIFKAKNKGDVIRIEITDHGTGIPEKDLPYIWDRYFKVNKQYARSQSGTGLGLSICKAILEAHKAGYGVLSEINKGSTFYFELKAYSVNNEN